VSHKRWVIVAGIASEDQRRRLVLSIHSASG